MHTNFCKRPSGKRGANMKIDYDFPLYNKPPRYPNYLNHCGISTPYDNIRKLFNGKPYVLKIYDRRVRGLAC